MKISKIKYRLVLKEPGKEEKILWTGTKKECENKKLDNSFTWNSKFLYIEEYSEDTEVKFTVKGILSFLLMAGLTYYYWSCGKKICIVD